MIVHQIDALVPGADRLRIDPRREIAALSVKLDDALGIVVDHGARERPARFRLHRLLRVLLLDLLVALESHPLDRRIFDDLDQDVIAVPGNGHVLEQPGRVEALERHIERRRIEVSVGVGMKMRTDHLRVDVPVAADGDRGLRRACGERTRASGEGEEQESKYDESAECDPARHRSTASRPNGLRQLPPPGRGASVTDCVGM